jgi:L-ascorbate metabolism protein UlaG (beta-lactamase superfamily)
MTQITWLGHATFQLRFDSGEVLLTDPWTEGNPAYPKGYNIQQVDAIAVSHAHFDHTNDVVPLAKKFDAKVVAIFETSAWLEKKGVKNTIGMNKGGTVDLGFAKLTMTHALHSSAIKDGSDLLYGGDAAGYVITQKDGRRFLPIGDHFTMDPHQAAHAARLLKVKRVIPMHFGTFPALTGTPEQLSEKLKSDPIEVWTLKQGEPVQW